MTVVYHGQNKLMCNDEVKGRGGIFLGRVLGSMFVCLFFKSKITDGSD